MCTSQLSPQCTLHVLSSICVTHRISAAVLGVGGAGGSEQWRPRGRPQKVTLRRATKTWLRDQWLQSNLCGALRNHPQLLATATQSGGASSCSVWGGGAAGAPTGTRVQPEWGAISPVLAAQPRAAQHHWAEPDQLLLVHKAVPGRGPSCR